MLCVVWFMFDKLLFSLSLLSVLNQAMKKWKIVHHAVNTQYWGWEAEVHGLLSASLFLTLSHLPPPRYVVFACVFQQPFHISRQTIREFNHYVVIMVNCLCNWRMFQPGIGVQLDEELLLESKVPQCSTRFGLIHHPAFIGYAVDFHQRVSLVRLACPNTCGIRFPVHR